MPKFHVSKSVTIAAPPEEVYASVRDFRQWREWSPWLVAEPDCRLTYADDGKSYTWEGKIIGSGELAVVDERPPSRINYRLTFHMPWKSVNKSAFMHARAKPKVFQQDKGIPHFEVYESDPAEVPENELVTVVHFPVKGPVEGKELWGRRSACRGGLLQSYIGKRSACPTMLAGSDRALDIRKKAISATRP